MRAPPDAGAERSITATSPKLAAEGGLEMRVAFVHAMAQRPLVEMAQELASAVDANVVTVMLPWASRRRSVASCETAFCTIAMSSPLVGSGTAARYVGPSPACTVWTVNDVASMYATSSFVGFALQTTFPVATG